MFYFGLTCCSSYSYGYIFKDGSFNAFILILRPRDFFFFFPLMKLSLLLFAFSLRTVISSVAVYQRFEVLFGCKVFYYT